jgi:hypothetical protein
MRSRIRSGPPFRNALARHPSRHQASRIQLRACVRFSNQEKVTRNAPSSHFVTGGRFGSTGSSRSLLLPDEVPLLCDKSIVLVRHGLSTWNVEGRIQGSSDESFLTDFGVQQVCSAAVLLAISRGSARGLGRPPHPCKLPPEESNSCRERAMPVLIKLVHPPRDA